MNRPTLALLTLAAGASLLVAQGPYGTTTLIAAPGSQANSPAAALVLSGSISDPGQPPLFPSLLGPTSTSVTLAWTIRASVPSPGASTVALFGAIHGASGSALCLAVSVVPGSFFCGGFANWPCATGPYLPQSSPSPGGIYHLTPATNLPFALLDGIGLGLNPALPAVLGASGSFPVSGLFPIGAPTPYFPSHFAFQALVLDPTTAAGFRFSAAFTIAEWDFYL